MGDFDSLVRLNVGGVWHTTTRNTLLSHPHTIFHKMLQEKPPRKQNESNDNTLTETNSVPKDKGYYFIDRDGGLFQYVLNFMRSSKLNLPRDFRDHAQLSSEARFYGLTDMEKSLTESALCSGCACVEVIETAHPEKIGICSARLIITEEHTKLPPISDVLSTATPPDMQHMLGSHGRSWVSTDITRLDWAEKLTSYGWKLISTTSFIRKLPDITGRGTDLCHVVDKWTLS